MKTITATALCQRLFRVLDQATRTIPTRVRYKMRDAVILGDAQYRALTTRRKSPAARGRGLRPLIAGRIREPLDEQTDAALRGYLGV
ncbi:MAG: hypothetical protein HY696_01105 [Deltaproteobacteria bacterium]|nr:hypothetical protein [Deltaproteobacteria bacterium]